MTKRIFLSIFAINFLVSASWLRASDDTPIEARLSAKELPAYSRLEIHIGTFTAFHFGQFKEKIDYIFVEKGKAKVAKSIIIRDSTNEHYPSDHFPVYTEISF